MSASGRGTSEIARASVVPLIFLLLAAWISFEALRVPVGTFRMPGAGFFPLGLGMLLGVFALCLWLLNRGRPASEAVTMWRERRQVICLTASVLAAALLFEHAGFILTMAAFLTITTSMLGSIAWAKSLVLAVVGSFAAYFLFARVLKIALPVGVFPM